MLSPYQQEFNPEQKKQNPIMTGRMFVELFVTLEGNEGESHRVQFSPEQEMILAELFAAMFPPRTPDAKFDFKVDPRIFKILRPPNV